MTDVRVEDGAPRKAGEEVLFEGHPAFVADVGSLLLIVLTLGLAALWFWLRSLRTLYRVTSQRVVIEHGLLSKRLEQTDLYRIRDYVVERPFGQRLLGTGNLIIKSMDQSMPEVRINRIKADVVDLYNRLREATEADKRSRAVRVIDSE